jgi:serine/threonine protein kinase/Flp pilus assembly protein TadD
MIAKKGGQRLIPKECPACAASNVDTALRCSNCRTPLPGSKSDETVGDGPREDWTVADSVTPGTRATDAATDNLAPGTLLAGRYEIVQLLGRGGMGAVYKAKDKELDRFVALKLIRAELAGNPEVLRRFKQELILARQVTHKNVIRIFDLGYSGGIQFITMDFVEGKDLRTLLRENGKFAPYEAARIMLQICRALEAAHAERVIHRDLKPQNIMIGAKGRVYVMDFGIARSAYLPGMTQTGALIGTPEYMSPEQARGEELDERSDIFSLGVIFYELLTGTSPYPSAAPLATLWKRMQEPATPPSDKEPHLPAVLNAIVVKALEIDPNKRFANAREMIQPLELWLGPTAESSTIFMPVPRGAPYWKWASAVLAVLLVAGVVAFRFYNSKPKAAHPPVTVLVADFTNHTGDPIFDDTLEPMFNVALEGASFINAYSRSNARKLAQKLPNPTDKLDEQSARLVAVGQGLGAVVSGSLSRRGDGYKLSVEALDARTGNSLATAEVNASNKDELLMDVPKLAAPIRKALGDATPTSVQLAASGPFTAASLEVVHLYSVGMTQQFAGKTQEALQSFSKAAELDPNFARAYSGMSATSGNLGKQQDAEKFIKLAMEHVDRMTERERYHTRALYYSMTGNYPKAVEEYSSLVNQYPADRVGQANLAFCLLQLRNIPRAVEAARKAVEIVPNAAFQRLTLSFLSSSAGDFQGGEREARAALQINPNLDGGYLNVGEAQLGQGQISQAAETYHKLEKLNAQGASMSVVALADLAAYEGRFADAGRLLEKGTTADLQAKDAESAANKLVALAHAELLRGNKTAGVASAEKALDHSQSVQVKFLAGRIFAETGEKDKAQKLAASLASEPQAEPKAYGKIIEGKTALQQGDTSPAIQAFTEANKLLDTWIGRFELGRAYLEAGLFVEADSEFDRCIKRRGEAMELFFDNVPTYNYFPLVYYYQGRVREGLKSPAFAESYRTYLSIRGQTAEDPLLPEIRKRLGH